MKKKIQKLLESDLMALTGKNSTFGPTSIWGKNDDFSIFWQKLMIIFAEIFKTTPMTNHLTITYPHDSPLINLSALLSLSVQINYLPNII